MKNEMTKQTSKSEVLERKEQLEEMRWGPIL